MARLSIFCLAYFTLTLLSGANAWTLTWRNDTGAKIVDGDSIRNCTRIYHEKGQEFAFNPEGEWCLKFWEEPTCQTQIGKTCEGRRWQQIASRNISAFNVYVMPPADISANGMATSTSSTSSTTTTTSSASTSAAATETTQPGGDEPPSSSLSGGAIAGIVIGAVAGVAILAALFFFWGRRKRNAAAPAPTDTTPAPGREQPLPEAVDPSKPAMSETQTQVSSVSPYGYPVAGGKTVELPGEKVGAELSNSRQLVEMGNTPLAEMDGTSIVKRP